MAINKNAKNINITVEEDYNLFVGGKIEKIANNINIESTKENLALICNKKINVQSNKK